MTSNHVPLISAFKMTFRATFRKTFRRTFRATFRTTFRMTLRMTFKTWDFKSNSFELDFEVGRLVLFFAVFTRMT